MAEKFCRVGPPSRHCLRLAQGVFMTFNATASIDLINHQKHIEQFRHDYRSQAHV
jgi:hypothetical protein